jgi:two-component system, chemotaxis family, chemotaxis protein CheY
MSQQTPPSPAQSAVEPFVGRNVIWTSFGLNEDWVGAHLLPIGERYRAQLSRGEEPESLQALERGEGDWDILFLGWDSPLTPDAGTPESIVRRIGLCRPLDCVVAVDPTATPNRLVGLLRAGAVDVLGMNSTLDQIERVFERVIEIIQARITRMEQDHLRLIGQLAISVNHEINNPLTGLMGTAELLLMDEKGLNEKVRRDLKTILTQCRRIQEVTARLKNLKQLRTVPYGLHDQMLDLVGEIQPALAPTHAPPSEQFLPAPRILVVDDNPLIIDLVARLFEQRFAIDAAGNASDALAKAGMAHYDLILVDLILPEMNGLELFRALRRLHSRQKVLLTTAYEGDARVEQAIVEGALGCIYKPFKLEDLELALTDALKPKTC